MWIEWIRLNEAKISVDELLRRVDEVWGKQKEVKHRADRWCKTSYVINEPSRSYPLAILLLLNCVRPVVKLWSSKFFLSKPQYPASVLGLRLCFD